MEASVIRCSSCGAPVGEHDVQCPYCKGQLASVSCPRCFGLVSLQSRFCSHCGTKVEVLETGGDSPLKCPECQVVLLNTPVGGVDLHQCQQCGGMWLAKDRFEALAQARANENIALPGQTPSSLPPQTAPVHYRKCPVCARFMNRVNYARISGIILDSCRDHGLWFDRNELRQVLTFVDTGGLEKARTRERLMVEEELRQKRAATSLPPDAGLPLGGPQEGRHDLADLVDTGSLVGRVLIGAAETLWRGFRK